MGDNNINSIEFILNKSYCIDEKSCPTFLSQDELRKVRNIHSSIPHCKATELVHLPNLSKYLGIRSIFVKNESKRGNINSFKILGATYAVTKLLCNKLNLNIEAITFDDIKEKIKNQGLEGITLTTCSDGNHGRGIAWTARELNLNAVIYMPKGTVKSRVENIEALGAKVIVTKYNYDDTVRYANNKAKENGWYIVQDTSWEGYEEIPKTILQGYSTMGMEAIEQLQSFGIKKPTHIFVQAGVGAMAGGVVGAIANIYKSNVPKIIIMEPTNAACYFKSIALNDGEPHNVNGDLDSIMAGLACGEPVREGWNILKNFGYGFFKCPDYITAYGMRILGNPLKEDERIIAGESAGVGIGLLTIITTDEKYQWIKDALSINEDSIVLFFSTEGDTDPINYRSIVWKGAYPLE